MPILRVRDIDVHVEESGQGPAVIIAHGAFGSVATAAAGLRPADYARGGFRAIAYDARGHGLSGYSRSADDYRRSERMRDLLALMDALGVGKAHIVGTSMGVGTALNLALHHPDRVGRLVLRSPPTHRNDPKVRCKLALLAACYRWLGTAATARFSTLVSDTATSPRLRGQLAQLRRSAVLPMIKGLQAESFYPQGLARVAARTLIIGQDRDSSHPRAAAEFLHATLPDSKLVIAGSKAHWEANPGEVRQLILDFLNA